MKRALFTLAALAILTGWCWSQEQPANVLSLDQAVAIALENSRSLRNSALEVQKAQDKLNATRTRQFPNIPLYALGAQQLQSFDFVLQKGILGTYSGSGPLPSEDVHLK